MATMLFNSVVEEYKRVTEVINSVDVNEKKDVRVKSLKDILTESFFHGATRFGDNFIA